MDLSDFRKVFDPVLERMVRGHVETFSARAQDAFLEDAARHIGALAAGGKRLRPYVARLGYGAGGGNNEELIMQLGASLELFHVFCLIHDDIIDKATTRRGVATVESFVTDRLTTQSRRGNIPYLAKSHAILLGDLVFSWASRHATQSALLSPLPSCVLDEYHDMVDEVVAGQMIDVDTMTRDVHDAHLLERKMYLKTAGYSFVRPLRLGACLSGNATEELLAHMTAIGTPIGIAFQLQDDVLDVTSTPDILGKPTLSDIRDGQQTFLTAFVAQHGTTQEKDLLTKVMQGLGNHQDIFALREVFLAGGALSGAQARIEALWEEGKQAVNSAQLAPEVHDALLALITKLQSRVR